MAHRRMIWITWENQIRNVSMSKELKIPLYVFTSTRGRLLRYLSCGRRTINVLFKKRPNVVVCQNPSIVLTAILLLLRKILKFRVVVDAHFAGVEANRHNSVFQFVLDRFNRCADLVIVTNSEHYSHIKSLGGNPFICPDPLPNLDKYQKINSEIDKKIFFICSFDVDEPYTEVFKAAELLHVQGFNLYVSGKYQKAGIKKEDFPHVNFLGFVSVDEFYSHLFTSQIIIDLTNNDNCLVCGAYEAMEAGKPLILSDKKVLMDFFSKGTVFTKNHCDAICCAITKAFSDKSKLKKEANDWRNVKKIMIKKTIQELKTQIDNIDCKKKYSQIRSTN